MFVRLYDCIKYNQSAGGASERAILPSRLDGLWLGKTPFLPIFEQRSCEVRLRPTEGENGIK